MKVHEYQGKELLRRFGVPCPRGRAAFSVEEARAAAEALGGNLWVVKAQIHAGGRGKGGGVKLARSLDEVTEKARQILGMRLVTHQTGPEGRLVKRLYIEEGCEIARELYLGAVLDRATSRVTFMLSTQGGVDIEEVAAKNPDAIIKIAAHPALGVQGYQVRDAASRLGLSARLARNLTAFLGLLYRAYVELDATLLEVNPLVVDSQEGLLALDVKLNFDDNALFRHPEVVALRDLDEEEPLEVQASKHDLSYINLDGDIGCLVNGAGLAMSTMDIIKHYGGRPANFLDVGGSATTERVREAFRILVADGVEVIFVNIFGGIMKCDTLAHGLVQAARELNLEVPVVVRLEGTNVELGKRLLAESGLKIITATSMADGAQRAVALAGKQ